MLKFVVAYPRDCARKLLLTISTKKWMLPVGVLLIAIIALIIRVSSTAPRVWNVIEIPIAFWSWQSETPSDSDIQQAVDQTGARTLFLRAGQIDYENAQLKRIRAVRGKMPRAIELHLVYNATRDFLFAFEKLPPSEIADIIFASFTEDLARATSDGAQVVGLQLDIDSPTRLLKHYARVLQSLRARLPNDMKLSITGLTTWMESRALKDALERVDFWVPQFYGAKIPEKLGQWIPISSPESVAGGVRRARRLGYAFYAGLAIYGYLILYASDYSFVTVRGDIDPARIANDPNLVLVNRGSFAEATRSKSSASEWYHIYRAERDTVISGLTVREGDWLMLDLPSTNSLRATVRAVREEAGQRLLGLCLFRLPAQNDPTNLTIKEVAAAIADQDGIFSLDARAVKQPRENIENDPHRITLTITNSGSMNLRPGEQAMIVELRVPYGMARSIKSNGFDSYKSFFINPNQYEYPCTTRRANMLRLSVQMLKPGASVSAIIEFVETPPYELLLRVIAITDKGDEVKSEQTIKVESE